MKKEWKDYPKMMFKKKEIEEMTDIIFLLKEEKSKYLDKAVVIEKQINFLCELSRRLHEENFNEET